MRAAEAIPRRRLPRPADVIRQIAAAPRVPARLPVRRGFRWLVALALLAGVLGAVYMLWFRDSDFVRVKKVTVTGLSGADAPRERAALVAAALRMTTLHLDEGALLRAMGAGATVESVRVTADFPHGLRIQVVQKAPVAVLVYGSERVAVGSGGVLLPGVRPLPRALPVIEVGALPSRGRLGRGRATRLVAAAAAAPVPLRPRVLRLRELPGKGLVAYIRSGPDVILGSPAELGAKWTAASAILADPSSRGASYIDVSLPDRPVAGGLSVAPAPPAMQATAPPLPPTRSGLGVNAPPPASAGTGTGAAATGGGGTSTATGQAAGSPSTGTPVTASPAPGTGTGAGTGTGGAASGGP